MNGYGRASRFHGKRKIALALWLPLLMVLGGSPHAAAQDGNGKTADLTFDDIKFEMEKDEPFEPEMLTEEIKALDGTPIRLRGFIRPSFKQSGLTQFVLVRDNQECCFGPGAMIYDCVLVTLDKGDVVEFTVRPITVEGTFFLKEFKGPDGKTWAIFRMKDTKVN